MAYRCVIFWSNRYIYIYTDYKMHSYMIYIYIYMYIYIYVYTVHAHRNTHTHTHRHMHTTYSRTDYRPDKCVHVTPRGWQPCRPWNSLWRPSFSVSFLEVTRRGKFCEHTQDRSNVETPLMTFEQFEPFFPTRLGFKYGKTLHVLAGPGDDQGPVRVLVF